MAAQGLVHGFQSVRGDWRRCRSRMPRTLPQSLDATAKGNDPAEARASPSDTARDPARIGMEPPTLAATSPPVARGPRGVPEGHDGPLRLAANRPEVRPMG